MNDEIVITFNTKRKVLLFVIALLFTLISLFFFVRAVSLTQNVWLLRIIGLIGLLCFGAMFVLLLIRITFRKVALIVNDVGIIDTSSAGGEAGLVKWEEIRDIEQFELNGATVLIVLLHNPVSFIENIKNPLIRFALRRNLKTYRTPVVIPLIALNAYIDTLEGLLKERLEKNRRLTLQEKGIPNSLFSMYHSKT